MLTGSAKHYRKWDYGSSSGNSEGTSKKTILGEFILGY